MLDDAAKNGLPGEHHFYISFNTRANGVHLSPRMLAQYPEEMTVVLQHQFWDLMVTEDSFEVGVSFGGIPERLAVPFCGDQGLFRSCGAVRAAVRRGQDADASAGGGPSRSAARRAQGARATKRRGASTSRAHERWRLPRRPIPDPPNPQAETPQTGHRQAGRRRSRSARPLSQKVDSERAAGRSREPVTRARRDRTT